jgi:RNA polymerase sigma-70 factor (ECF subfamily)
MISASILKAVDLMPDPHPHGVALPRLAAALAPQPHGSPAGDEVIRLFDRYRNPLARYLFGFGLAVADTEEIIQEAFLLLFEHLRAGKPRDNLQGWLFRVAHNLALKRLREARRTSARAGDLQVCDDRVVDPSPNPEDQAAHRQRSARVRAVIHALPEQDRRCLFLRGEGLSYREIGAVLEMSLGAVSISLARSLARIARATVNV